VRLCTALCAATVVAGSVLAQQDLEISRSAPLESRSDVEAFFRDLTQRQIRRNTDILVEIDAAYSEAVRELSAENRRRLNELIDEQRAALDALSDLPADERRRLTQQIQSELTAARAALAEWRASESERIGVEYSSGRETQQSLHNALVERVQAERRRVVADIANGPVDIEAVLAAIGTDPQNPNLVGQKAATGAVATTVNTGAGSQPALPAGGVDLPAPIDEVAGTVAVRSPIAGAERDRLDETGDRIAGVDARVNTLAAPPDFDIALYSVGDISFSPFEPGSLRSPEPDSSLFLAETMYVRVTIANRGARTYAFEGNRIEATFVEGYFEPGQSGFESSDGLRAAASHSLRMEVGQAQVIDMALYHEPVRASREDRAGAGITRVLSGGFRGSTNDGYRAPVEIDTLLWYTIDVRLFPPAEYDANDDAHGAYLHVRFNEDGEVKELDGPHFYAPG
jgi:hypothetical protein